MIDDYRTVRLLQSGPAGPELERLLAYLERSPAEPFLLNVAGVRAYELGRFDDAAALFERAYTLDPTLPAVATNLAGALVAGTGWALDGRVSGVLDRARPAAGRTLSLCMIVRDEEDSIEACLASALPFVDEAIVLDTGSTDRTRELAARAGARVFEAGWNDSFAEARNLSMAEACGDWILYLDADERLEDGDALRRALGHVWREGLVLEVVSATGPDSGTRHPSLRVFRNRPDYRFAGRIHEQIAPTLPLDLPERFERVPVRIRHDGYRPELVSARAKSQRNLRLLALEAEEAPGPYTSFNLGNEYLRLGDWAEAARHLDAAWAGVGSRSDWTPFPFAPALALRAARARRELGRLGAAREVLLTALDRTPDYTDLVYELACCELAAGGSERAAALLEHCLELGDAGPNRLGTIGAGGRLAAALLDRVRAGVKTRPGMPITA